MSIKEYTRTGNRTSSNWILKPEKDYFTHDELIDAYLKGKEAQKNENKKILIEKLEANLKKAQDIVENLVEEIRNKGFKIYKSYLRINNIVKFDAIFDISIEDYTSDAFDEIYEKSQEIKKIVNSDTFHLNLTFMPHNDNLNEQRVVRDGFIFSYEKRL